MKLAVSLLETEICGEKETDATDDATSDKDDTLCFNDRALLRPGGGGEGLKIMVLSTLVPHSSNEST